MKKIVKKIVPERLLGYLTGFFYGWHGNYKNWHEAQKMSDGYDMEIILEKVKQSSLEVKRGNAVFERDSVLFYNHAYSYPILVAILLVAARNEGKLHVLDFGGALGSSFFQYKPLLKDIKKLKWFIVEQTHFVNTGKQHFQDESLLFYHTIEECMASNQIDLLLLSSVLQYLEKPFDFLAEIINKRIKYVLIDRTPFIKKPDRITVQKVRPKIYKAKYPCWFFNEDKFLKFMQNSYQLIFEFDALDKANLPSRFKGYLFKIKN